MRRGARQPARRAGALLGDERAARRGEAVAVVEDVVAHLGQLPHAIGLQRPAPLVAVRGSRPSWPASARARVRGERAGVLDDGGVEARPVAGQRRVRQPDLHGLRGCPSAGSPR